MSTDYSILWTEYSRLSVAEPGWSQRKIPVLLRRIPVALRAQRVERVDQPRACVARVDDVVDVAAAGGDVRVRELRRVLGHLGVHRGGRVVRFGDLALVDDL